MDLSGKKYELALANFPKFGPMRLRRLKSRFPDARAAFTAGLKELTAAGLDEKIAAEFIACRETIDPDGIINRLDKEGVGVVTIDDSDYPKLLREIYDPPPVLYYRGRLSARDEFALAVVGTRKFTAYGRQAAEMIARDLARRGITVTSGLAIGIDALVHAACVEADGRTVAVLGSGLDRQSIYPSVNRHLAERILAAGGALVSEFPLGTPPLKHHFPQRNRLIAGLTLGTLVVEAGEKSGALITARHALEQNREVFALPGSIFSPYSYGPHALLKQGARLITAAADIVDALDLSEAVSSGQSREVLPETEEERLILGRLGHEPVHIDELARQTGLGAAGANSVLALLEIKGLVKNMGGMTYVLAR